MNSHTWPLRENVRYLSVLMLCVLCLVFDSRQLLFLLASWISLIVIFGNVRHLPHSSGLLYALRMTLYFLPYALPAVIFLTSGFTFNARAAIGCAASLLLYGVWVKVNYRALRVLLSKDAAASAPKEPKLRIILMIYNSAGASVCEELFFRAFIFSIDIPVFALVPVSAALFVASHYMLPWGGRFTRSDHLNQLLTGLACSLIFIYSGSVIPCVLLHTLMNTPTILMYARRFDRHYLRKEYYDTKQINALDELNI